MPPTQTLSINKMRGFTVRVMRGFLVLASLPVLYVFVRTLQITRHLPRLDLAPARSPLLWLSVALMVAASLMIRFGPARIRLTAPYLWVLIVASFSVVAAVVVTFVVVSYKLLGTKLAVSPEKALLLGALELSLSILWCWWFFLSPAWPRSAYSPRAYRPTAPCLRRYWRLRCHTEMLPMQSLHPREGARPPLPTAQAP
jgi:hypothetical protein